MDAVAVTGRRGEAVDIARPRWDRHAEQFQTETLERFAVLFDRLLSGVITIEGDQQATDVMAFESVEQFIGQPVGSVDRRHVAIARRPERQRVDDRFAQNDFVGRVQRFAVEDAAMRTRQIEVTARVLLAVVDPPTVKLFQLAVDREQRERHAAAEVFMSAVAKDAEGFQTLADFPARLDLFRRQPQPQRAIDEADPEPLDRFVIVDPA